MKRHFLIFQITLMTVLVCLLCGCYEAQERRYYSDTSNFMVDTATVDNIIYNDESQYIYLWLSDYDRAFSDPTLGLFGENANVVLRNGILDKLETGDEITFAAAPEYFGDGYVVPIVAITVDAEELLSFDEGYENLMETFMT